jgi:hypothetical protein
MNSAKNQTAIGVSKMRHANDDVGRNGQIGFPYRRWTTSSRRTEAMKGWGKGRARPYAKHVTNWAS